MCTDIHIAYRRIHIYIREKEDIHAYLESGERRKTSTKTTNMKQGHMKMVQRMRAKTERQK